jgi:hypothetical protein
LHLARAHDLGRHALCDDASEIQHDKAAHDRKQCVNDMFDPDDADAARVDGAYGLDQDVSLRIRQAACDFVE